MFFAIFIFFWLAMLYYQFRDPQKRPKYLDPKDYVFYSNLRIDFPKWFVRFLFLNCRMTKIPLPTVIGQITNYVLFAYFCVRKFICFSDTSFYLPLLKFWGICYILYFIVIFIDFLIYSIRHRWF